MPSLIEALRAINASDTANLCLTEDDNGISTTKTQRAQIEHRAKIYEAWLESCGELGFSLDADIIGKTTLDVGCGQGDMTALFASVLKSQGDADSRVIGVDPARSDYGSPFTLGQAQQYLASGPLSDHISFVQALAPDLVLSHPAGTFSTAMFVHSLYYMPSAAVVTSTFQALRESGVKTLLLAEWALSISTSTALPHLLAVLLQSVDPIPEGNVRTVLSPRAYIDAAKKAGWEFVVSKTITPGVDVEDGKWEVYAGRTVAKQHGLNSTTKTRKEEDDRSAHAIKVESLRTHADALENSLSEHGPSRVTSMDVWTAVFRSTR